jgi:hypothetical protein
VPLTGGRRLLLSIHAAACAVVVRAALHSFSIPLAVRAASAAGALCRTRATDDECLAAAARAVARLSHPTCLYRALTAYALLAHRHPGARFHLGAWREAGLAAHAWITIGGRALDVDSTRYATLWTATRGGGS